MDYKSNSQKFDAYRYISQNKASSIYEPVLKYKEEKPNKLPNNEKPYSNNNLKNQESIPKNTQKDAEDYELAQAQRSLKLLKSKMSVTPKQIFNPYEKNEEPKNFKNIVNNLNNGSSETNIYLNSTQNTDVQTAQNKNYRKVFKPEKHDFILF